jgi:hypothetical protein
MLWTRTDAMLRELYGLRPEGPLLLRALPPPWPELIRWQVHDKPVTTTGRLLTKSAR